MLGRPVGRRADEQADREGDHARLGELFCGEGEDRFGARTMERGGGDPVPQEIDGEHGASRRTNLQAADPLLDGFEHPG